MADTNTYVIALKRNVAQVGPVNWQNTLSQFQGVKIISCSPHRAQFAASDDAIARVRSELSPNFLIEGMLERDTLQ